MTKDGSNARKQAARDLAKAEQITYTDALRRLEQPRTAKITRPVPARTSFGTLVGHTGYVVSVAFHPDGNILVSGGDTTVRLWDVAQRQATTVLSDENRIDSVALSPDGATVAVAGERRPPELWALATGEITTLTGSIGHITAVAFSPDGGMLATSESPAQRPTDHLSREQTIRLWDLSTTQAVTLSTWTRAYGHAVAFHPAGHTVAGSAGVDGTAQLVDLTTRSAMVLAGHGTGVAAVAFGPDGRTLATGSDDTTVRLWDVATGQTIHVLEPRAGYVVAVAFSPDGLTLASAGTDGTVRLWDPATGLATATLFGAPRFVTSMAFSPDGQTLAGGTQEGVVHLWSLG